MKNTGMSVLVTAQRELDSTFCVQCKPHMLPGAEGMQRFVPKFLEDVWTRRASSAFCLGAEGSKSPACVHR